MCGPSIPGGSGEIDRMFGRTITGPRLAGGRTINLGGFAPPGIGTLPPTPPTEAETTALERKRKVKSGGRESTILAGGNIARESRRKSLLAASNAEEQRKTLLGQ